MITRIIPSAHGSNGIASYCQNIENLLPQSSQRNVLHAELGYGLHHEFWVTRRLLKAQPDYSLILTLHDPPVVVGKPFAEYLSAQHVAVKTLRKLLDLTLGRWFVYKLVRKADIIIVLNPLAARGLAAKFGVDPKRIHYVPAPSSLPVPSIPVASKRPDSKLEILFFGNLSPRKGVLELIQGFDRALGNQSTATLRIIGDYGSERRYYNRLLAAKANCQRPLAIVFEGYVDDARLSHFLTQADIVVLPYHDPGIIHSSGPLTTAMAFGKCVAATAIPIFQAELTHDRGYLLPDTTVDAIALVLSQMISNPSERARRANRAQEHIRTAHSADIIKRKLGEVYQSV